MVSRRFVVLAVALAVSTPLAVRAEPRRTEHALGFGAGYAHYGVLDEAATSLPYAAHLVTGELAYVGEAPRWRWAVRLGTAFGHEEATNHPGRTIRFVEGHVDGTTEVIVVPMRGTLHMPSAELSLERRVAFGATSLLVGGAARFDVAYAQGFATPGLMQLVALRPSIVLRYRAAERHTFELGAQTTLVGWMTRMPYHQTVSRPNASPYAGLVRQGSRFVAMNELQTIELEASYELRFGAHGTARGALGLDWLHDREPRPLRALVARAGLSILYRF